MKESVKIGMWHMISNVLVASISKGQFPIALIAIILIVVILRLPQQDLAWIVKYLWESFKNWYIVGYALGIVSIAGWVIHVRIIRSIHYKEMDRIATEKTKWQELALGSSLIKSSSKKQSRS